MYMKLNLRIGIQSCCACALSRSLSVQCEEHALIILNHVLHLQGDVITFQGEEGNEMFFLLEGK